MRVPAPVRGGDGSSPAPPPRPLRRGCRSRVGPVPPPRRARAGRRPRPEPERPPRPSHPRGRRTVASERTVIGDPRGLGLGLGLGTARGGSVLVARVRRLRDVDGVYRIASSFRRSDRADVDRRSRGFQTGGSSRSRVVRVFRRRGRRVDGGGGVSSGVDVGRVASDDDGDGDDGDVRARRRASKPTRASRHPRAAPPRALGRRGTARRGRRRVARALGARIRRDARRAVDFRFDVVGGPDGFRRRRRRGPRARDARVPVRAPRRRRARRRARER